MLTKLLGFFTAIFVSFHLISPSPTPSSTLTPSPRPTLLPTPTLPSQIIHQTVPFTSQAPNYDWKDERLQDGCEETAIIMAMHWINNKPLPPDLALSEILKLVDYQKTSFEEYRDTSLADTASRLLYGYYHYDNYQIINDVSLEKIIEILYQNSLVIAPMNGQMLKNPNYTGAGPERHMILITGYDPTTREFITNDAGTWRGHDYRFPADLFYAAIRDYQTGYHVPITKTSKNILVIPATNS